MGQESRPRNHRGSEQNERDGVDRAIQSWPVPTPCVTGGERHRRRTERARVRTVARSQHRESLSPSPECETGECAWLGWREMTEPLRRVRERQRGGERCQFYAPSSPRGADPRLAAPTDVPCNDAPPRQTERHVEFSPPSVSFHLVPVPPDTQRFPTRPCLRRLSPTRTDCEPGLLPRAPTPPQARGAERARMKGDG